MAALVCLAGASLSLVPRPAATQVAGFTLLHSFAHSPEGPESGLALDAAGNVYGTSHDGGGHGMGAVFRLRTDGTGFTVLHSFGGSDGSGPVATLILDGSGNLYGTTAAGGPAGDGVVFTLKTDGTGYNVLHAFGPGDGMVPYASLALDASGFLYGTTRDGGSGGQGIVFKIRTDGNGYAVLHNFNGGSFDGSAPYGGVALDGSGNLYGTTRAGGANNLGTVYKIHNDGNGFSLLNSFAGGNTDAEYPQSSLILDTSSGFLYGTALNGGPSNFGAVFKLSTNGSGYTVLHFFLGGTSDGASPYYASVALAGGVLYGTTFQGGAMGFGTVYRLGTDSSGFAILHSFTGSPSDGSFLMATPAVDSSQNVYGTTLVGGPAGKGTIWRVSSTGSSYSILEGLPGSDGEGPQGPPIVDGSGNLYATTHDGGAHSAGVVFTMKTDGTGYAVLHDFSGADGAASYAGLLLDSSGYLYGTTGLGGSVGQGTVFKVKTNGTGFSSLYSFSGPDGSQPFASLVLDGSGFLYGTTRNGGSSDLGTVFKIKTDGTGFAVIHHFASGTTDAQSPYAALLLDPSGSLYGTTRAGGASNGGAVFRLDTNGTGFTLLHSFAGGPSDGQYPQAALIADGSGYLYGTTVNGGPANLGTVFKIRMDGTGYAVLHFLAGGASEGANPFYSALALDGSGNLYSTTFQGGAPNRGTVFRMRTDGSGFVLLHSFAGPDSDGGFPFAGPTLDASGNLYGMTETGGSAGLGTVFALYGAAPPPPTTPTPTAFFPITPCRLVDTRGTSGPLGGPALASGESRTFVLAGHCSIPGTASALAINIAVTQPTSGPGFLTLYPGGIARPLASTINYTAGRTRANNAVVRLGSAGDIEVFCEQGSGTVHLVLDVNGYFQ